MATDQQVTARMVLEAQLELERRGAGALMQHLEKTEPELANFVLESLSLIYQKLANLGGPPQKTKRAFCSVQTLLLVSLEALRRGHLVLWEKQMGSALRQLDPEAEVGADRQPEA
ncbi:MAG TPA: hypothetical protein VK797_00645 [Tepidisphaeraceae bacterium]|nr:hypothetical protein [Tepidisphaeraceae bacterium]